MVNYEKNYKNYSKENIQNVWFSAAINLKDILWENLFVFYIKMSFQATFQWWN